MVEGGNKMTEINLNDKLNLNPTIRELTEEQREKVIEKWNVKQDKNDFQAIDKRKERPIKKSYFSFLKVLSFFGVLALIIIAGGILIFSYLAWNDGTLLANPAMLICGNVTVSVPECPPVPSCPNCPSCSVDCGDTKVNIINGTS